jgi:hypothetical protein
MLDTIVEKVYLQIERPTMHVFVKVDQIRIVVNVFKMSLPFVVLCQLRCERGFAGADVAGHGNVLGLCF